MLKFEVTPLNPPNHFDLGFNTFRNSSSLFDSCGLIASSNIICAFHLRRLCRYHRYTNVLFDGNPFL